MEFSRWRQPSVHFPRGPSADRSVGSQKRGEKVTVHVSACAVLQLTVAGLPCRSRTAAAALRRGPGAGWKSGLWGTGDSASRLWFSSRFLRCRRRHGSGALLPNVYPTRLETRTKESNMYASLRVTNPRGRNESKRRSDPSPSGGGERPARRNERNLSSEGRASAAQQERTRWDPKDGELCLSRTKPEETLVEVRSDSDVQIDRQT